MGEGSRSSPNPCRAVSLPSRTATKRPSAAGSSGSTQTWSPARTRGAMACGVAPTLRPRRDARIRARSPMPDPTRRLGPSRPPIPETDPELKPDGSLERRVVTFGLALRRLLVIWSRSPRTLTTGSRRGASPRAVAPRPRQIPCGSRRGSPRPRRRPASPASAASRSGNRARRRRARSRRSACR